MIFTQVGILRKQFHGRTA